MIRTIVPNFDVKFKNNHVVYETFIKCTVKDYEFNASYNSTLLSGSQGVMTPFSSSVSGSVVYITSQDNYGILKDFATGSISGSEFSPYVSTVGLYNDAQELLATAKISAPMPLSPDTDQTFLIKWDLNFDDQFSLDCRLKNGSCKRITTSPTPTPTPTNTPTVTPTPTNTPTATPIPPTDTPTPTPTGAPTNTPTPTPTETPTPTPTATLPPPTDTPTPTPTGAPTNTPTPTPTETPTPTPTCTPLSYSYTLIYSYDDGPCTLYGWNSGSEACAATVTSSVTLYSPSSSFAVGTPLYCDSCGTTPIYASPYTDTMNNYFRYNGNYVQFETDAYTVRSITPCSTPTPTPTPTVTPTPTPTNTPTSTPTPPPPTDTPTPTPTPTETPTPPPTDTPTPTPTPTATNTPPPPTPTPTPVTELFVYAKYVNTAPGGGDELEYQINAGSWLSFGAPISSTTCAYFSTVSGVSNGDTISFRTTLTSALSGDPSSCPGSAVCTTPSVVLSTGPNYIYLTTDGGLTC